MKNLEAFERLDMLADSAQVLIETASINHDIQWAIYIRPIGGGFPLVKAYNHELAEAVKKALEAWEDR